MKKKLLALLLSAVMVCSMAGCGNSSNDTAANNTSSADSGSNVPETSAAENTVSGGDTADQTGNTTYTVGICQLVQHDALDAATKGFKDALIEELGADNVVFDEQNAQGESKHMFYNRKQLCIEQCGFDSCKCDTGASGSSRRNK